MYRTEEEMTTITLTLPEDVELDGRQTARFLAAKLYEDGQLTLGQAAALAQLSKIAFAEILGDYGVSLYNYPIDEITQDANKI